MIAEIDHDHAHCLNTGSTASLIPRPVHPLADPSARLRRAVLASRKDRPGLLSAMSATPHPVIRYLPRSTEVAVATALPFSLGKLVANS